MTKPKWKFGDVLKLNDTWNETYPDRLGPDLRLMFVGSRQTLFIGTYLTIEGEPTYGTAPGVTREIFSRV